MPTKTILLLGAGGNTGRFLAELLLQYSDVRLKVASRSAEKAAELAAVSMIPGPPGAARRGV